MQQDVMAPSSPIWTKGQLNFKKMKELTGANDDELAQILKVSPATIRAKTVSGATTTKAAQMIHILNLLWALSNYNEAEVRRWLSEPRIEWMGLTPRKCLMMDRAQAVVEILERAYYGEISAT